MALSDIKIKALKAGIKPNGSKIKKTYKVFDEKGLYIEVTNKGSKRWRFKYRFEGKEKLLSLGIYPDVTLKQARERRDELRKQVANGVNPSDKRKAEKQSTSDMNSFESIAREWFSKFSANWSESHASRTILRLEQNIFPYLGNKNINEITAPELLTALRRIENRGALETAHRVRSICGQVFRYGIATGRCERDCAADILRCITPTRELNITPR
ncbi:MAG: Arm DNA-binding domain-containing protein [Gammaproteobacteria bacterium]|nr:Arm DNA-binding domain-containing protein [Gammaproteobacteria bacterium]